MTERMADLLGYHFYNYRGLDVEVLHFPFAVDLVADTHFDRISRKMEFAGPHIYGHGFCTNLLSESMHVL